MSSDTKGYNGWTNYETWCVYTWSTSDQNTYMCLRYEAQKLRTKAPSHPNVRDGIWTAEEAARFTFAEWFKGKYEYYHPFRGEFLGKPAEPDVYCDLLDAALSEVNWDELAEAFLEELEPEDEPDPEDERGDEAEEEEASEEPEQENTQGPEGPRFELGRVVSTPGALEAITREEIMKALSRHHRGDWGEVGPEDWQENETSLREGFRLLSVYRSERGERFWVITEADRSVTTILLPSEY